MHPDYADYEFPPGFGNPDLVDAYYAQNAGMMSTLGDTGEGPFLDGSNRWYMVAGGAVLLGGLGALLGSQKSLTTAAIAGSGAAVVGGIAGYYAPDLLAKMAGR